jgi:hypothetical protein
LSRRTPTQPPVVIDALDRVSVQLELAHDGGREVNPVRAQLGKSDRLVAGSAQSLKHSLLLGINERHRRDCRPERALRARGAARGRGRQTVWSCPGDAKGADSLLATTAPGHHQPTNRQQHTAYCSSQRSYR